jgi:cytochrome P450
MFLGATDTTATTMEWAMAELVNNPSAMKKVQEEVRGVVGEKSKVEEIDIDQMDFLKCIVKETLRLHPPLFIGRRTSASLELEGYHIPANLKVMINSWAIQRDPKLWDSPEEFIPDRFANKSVDFKGQNHQFIPFGAGRRGCPGIAFAVVEVEHVLANILYWFDWEFPEGITAENLDMSEVFTPVIRKKSPLHLVPVAHFQKTISN